MLPGAAFGRYFRSSYSRCSLAEGLEPTTMEVYLTAMSGCSLADVGLDCEHTSTIREGSCSRVVRYLVWGRCNNLSLFCQANAVCCCLSGRCEDSLATRSGGELERQGQHHRSHGGFYHGPQGRRQAPVEGETAGLCYLCCAAARESRQIRIWPGCAWSSKPSCSLPSTTGFDFGKSLYYFVNKRHPFCASSPRSPAAHGI